MQAPFFFCPLILFDVRRGKLRCSRKSTGRHAIGNSQTEMQMMGRHNGQAEMQMIGGHNRRVRLPPRVV